MEHYNPSQCRACGAPIRWVTSPKGKVLPVDWELFWFSPDEKGALLVVKRDGTTARGYRVEGASLDASCADDPRRNLFLVGTAHWATCPHAGELRREESLR